MQIVHPSTFYTHVHVDLPHELMKHVIGTNGKWFKYTCDKCVVSNIWFNKERSIVEIWGPIANLMPANFAIQARINVIKDRFSFKDDTDNVKMWPNDEFEEVMLSEISINDNFIGSHLSSDHIRILIGKFGHGFKRITRESGVSFIWFDIDKQSIQIWGLKDDIEKAKLILIARINSIVTNDTNVNEEA